jgi:cold shock CspA family protein
MSTEQPEEAQSAEVQPAEVQPAEEVAVQSGEDAPAVGTKRALEEAEAAPAEKKQKMETGPEPAPVTATKTWPEGVVRETGTVKWYDTTKGFGFLIRDNVTEGDSSDVFVHRSCLTNRPGTTGIGPDEKVEFHVTTEASGRLRANEVTQPGGELVQGVPDPSTAAPAYTIGYPGGATVDPKSIFPAHTEETLPEGRARGTVKWFDPAKGFGFITPLNGSGDVFVHQSVLKVNFAASKTLAQDENVEYGLQTDSTGRVKADDVTGPGGKPVIGQAPAPPPVPAAPLFAYPYMAYAPAAAATAQPYGAPAQPSYGALLPSPYGQAPPAPAAPAAPATQSYDYGAAASAPAAMTPEQYQQYQQQWAAYYAANPQAAPQ